MMLGRMMLGDAISFVGLARFIGNLAMTFVRAITILSMLVCQETVHPALSYPVGKAC